MWSEIMTKDAPSRARMRVRADDIIVSLTRPHHGSISHLSDGFDGCIASTGFAIIRDVAPRVRRDYLWCALRASFCLDQMLQRASGGNYPAITETELANIVVPVPSLHIQTLIATEAERRRLRAAVLRADADRASRDVKRWFEVQLLSCVPQ